MNEKIVGCEEFCTSVAVRRWIQLVSNGDAIPFSGAELSAVLAVTTFFNTSIRFSSFVSCNNGAHSDCSEDSSPWFFLRLSMYVASSSTSSSKVPSISSVFDGAGMAAALRRQVVCVRVQGSGRRSSVVRREVGANSRNLGALIDCKTSHPRMFFNLCFPSGPVVIRVCTCRQEPPYHLLEILTWYMMDHGTSLLSGVSSCSSKPIHYQRVIFSSINSLGLDRCVPNLQPLLPNILLGGAVTKRSRDVIEDTVSRTSPIASVWLPSQALSRNKVTHFAESALAPRLYRQGLHSKRFLIVIFFHFYYILSISLSLFRFAFSPHLLSIHNPTTSPA